MQRDPPASLRSVQAAFAAALDAPDDDAAGAAVCSLFTGAGGMPHDARFAVYRNNSRVFFGTALERSFPVLQRRVGGDAFVHLAAAYRAAHPSRRGDLHHAGTAFPSWLEQRFAGTEFAWLADLARLEWACELAMIAAVQPPVTAAVLGSIAPEQLEYVVLTLQPSLQLMASSYPVWSVWQANQGPEAGPAMDLSAGPEQCAVACLDDRPVVYRLDARHFQTVRALHAGRSLGAALEEAAADATLLQDVLGWLFAERLVVTVT